MTNVRDVAQTELQRQLTSSKKSAVAKYIDIVVGQPGLLKLLKMELIAGFIGVIPGAFGMALRHFLFPRLFARCGKGVVFGRNMTIRHPHKIRIGDNVIFDDLVVLDAKGENNQGITIGANVIVARNTVLSCKGGDIEIGDNTNISLNCMVHSESSVKLGSNILIAAYCYIIGGGMHDTERVDVPIIQQGSTSKGITLGDNLWLGAGVKVLDGSVIERDCVIAAGAIVNRTIPEFSIAAGVPARVVKRRISASTQPLPEPE